MANQPNKTEEEVDLGSLFVIIGKGFAKFFNFIGSIFKGIFHLIILCLLFFKNNAIKLGIATIVGGAIGAYFQVETPKKYGSIMLLEPNYKSSRQLYNNIAFYDDLVKQKDTLQLQKIFNISSKEAASLKKFEIEPIKVKTDVIDAYNDFVSSADTTTVKSYTFDDYKESFTIHDYKVHKITVEAEINDIFRKLDEVILQSVTNNKYFDRINQLTNQNLNRTDSIFNQNLSQIDSLRKVYMTVMIEEAKKQTAGTNIDLGGDKKTTKEIELFEANKKINEDLRYLADERAKKFEIINVISNFQPVGYEISGLTKNFISLFAILGFSLMTVFLLALKINTYLNNYKS